MSVSSVENKLVMSGIGKNYARDNAKPMFWKKNNEKTLPGSVKQVYGAQHPPRQEKITGESSSPKKDSKQKHRDSFKNFQENTRDAWDDGEDGDLSSVAELQLNMQDVQKTALQVIYNHSLEQAKAKEKLRSESSNQPQPSTSLSAEESFNLQMNTNASAQDPLRKLSVGKKQHDAPGMAVRLNVDWRAPKMVPIQMGQFTIPDRELAKIDKFKSLVEAPNVDLDELRKLSWNGISKKYRATTWKILSGYIPPALDRREPTLQRKRQEYFNFVDQYFETRHQDLHQDTYRQIHIDIPRMNPLLPIFQQSIVQEMFERILYIWAIRHPASDYVQGINDLVTPFFVVFLTQYISNDIEVENCDLSQLPQDSVRMLEADCFWCFSKLLDGIQDNYTFAQPGIQNKIKVLKELVHRIDKKLHDHLEKHNVEYLQFTFRWMNNMLMREIPLHCVVRLWDTYLAEPDGFASFHLYVCAAFLIKFSHDLLRERDFQGLMLMLQNLPTHNWTNEEVDLLVAEGYKLKFMFADAPNHLIQNK